MTNSHERWLRLVAERLHKQQRDYSIANTCDQAADAIAAMQKALEAAAQCIGELPPTQARVEAMQMIQAALPPADQS